MTDCAATGRDIDVAPAAQLTPNNGPTAGTNIVTITGSNLGSGSDITVVQFGNTASEVRTQTANSVTVTVPPGPAGAATVAVRSTTRGETLLTNAYTYNAGMISELLCCAQLLTFSVAGLITSIVPTNGPVAGGQTITVHRQQPRQRHRYHRSVVRQRTEQHPDAERDQRGLSLHRPTRAGRCR